MNQPHKKGWLLNLGRTDYDRGLDIQSSIESRRKSAEISDVLILLEHDPVYTLGRSSLPENLLMDRNNLQERGIKVREIRRGGDITYHGPGQLVAYPIIDLSDHKKDVHWYLRKLEEVIIGAMQKFDLECQVIEGMTGVWCNGGKIAAIGVGLSRWVTTHGFALNVDTNLDYFKGIVPCGLTGKQVTSIQAQLNQKIEMTDVREIVADEFSEKFALDLTETDEHELSLK